jgi:PAS domain S-box-containing protein
MNTLQIHIEKLWLKTKLMIGFSVGLVVAAAIGINSLNSLSVLEAEMERMYEMDLLGISHIKEANINLIYMGRAMRQMMIAQDSSTRDKARSQVKAAHDKLLKELEEGRKRIIRDEVIALHDEFLRTFSKFNENVEHAILLIEREQASTSEAAKFITSPEFITVINTADEALTAMTKVKEKGSRTKLDEVKRQIQSTRNLAMLMLALGILGAIGLGVLIGNSIKRPNERLRNSVEALAGGDVASNIPHTDYPNEIGILARAIAVLQGIYRKAEDTRWVKTHSAEIATHLQQAEDQKTLAQAAVSRIAPALKAGHGALYVLNAERRLALLGSFGYRERKNLNNGFSLGEGLVGQCAMEKQAITLTAPQDYIQINSGLGEAPPACISVLPIVHNDCLLGVFEIASFQQFSEREIALLDSLMPVLAVSIEIMDRNQRTRDLLASTQEQSERMEKQAAQLEEQTVEMEAQQSELLETENWFRSIIETAPDGMLVFNESNTIVLTNPSAEALFGYAVGELMGAPLAKIMSLDALASGSTGQICAVAGQHKDGHALSLSLNLSHLPSRGRHGRCVSVAVRLA